MAGQNDYAKCATCGARTHINDLDATPSSVTAGFDIRDLTDDHHAENWERFECRDCYGWGFNSNPRRTP